eukprot:PhM_4_TR16662/c0_g3_i1/m.23589
MGSTSSRISDSMAEKQRHAALAQREMMLAVQLARLRDDLSWVCGFWAATSALGIMGAMRTGKGVLAFPMVPGSIMCAYMYDAAYGRKTARILEESENILRKERERFVLPEGNRIMSPEEYRKTFILTAAEEAARVVPATATTNTPSKSMRLV